jgi:hypothetical protein
MPEKISEKIKIMILPEKIKIIILWCTIYDFFWRDIFKRQIFGCVQW